jgi:hypothetical protein
LRVSPGRSVSAWPLYGAVAQVLSSKGSIDVTVGAVPTSVSLLPERFVS